MNLFGPSYGGPTHKTCVHHEAAVAMDKKCCHVMTYPCQQAKLLQGPSHLAQCYGAVECGLQYCGRLDEGISWLSTQALVLRSQSVHRCRHGDIRMSGIMLPGRRLR